MLSWESATTPVRADATPITRHRNRKRCGCDDDKPSFSQIIQMINNKQNIDQRLQQEEKEAEWEERRQHYEEQCEDRRLQFQMHQDDMQHQQQFMTTMLLMMHGNMHSRAPIMNIPPMTLGGYIFPINNQQEEEEKHGEGGIQRRQRGKQRKIS